MRQATVNISELRNRFDVRFHASEDAQFGSSWSLGDLKATIVRDPNCYGFNYARTGIPLIRISDMKQPFIDFSRVALISSSIHQRFAKTHLQPNDILISVRGMSTGKVSIFLGEVGAANISPNIIIVRLQDRSLAPYVTMTLMSAVGQTQIGRLLSGGGKPSLTAPMIERIQIPIPSEGRLKEINKLFCDAAQQRLRARVLMSEIDGFFGELHTNVNAERELTNEVTLTSLGTRWDAHFHNKAYVGFRAFLEMGAKASKKLCDLAPPKSSIVGPLNRKSKLEYIEIGSVDNTCGIIDRPIVDYPENLPIGAKVAIEEGDLLVSKVRPYLNANTIFHTSDKALDSLASKNAFAVFQASQLPIRFYVAAFLRSHIGLSQVTMYQSGTSYPTVSDDDIQNIRILMASSDEMDAVDKKFKLFMDLKLLEQFAVRAMVELIEDEMDIADLENELA